MYVCQQVNANELTNGVINAAFMLLFKDAIRLFAAYNEGIINLLGELFLCCKGTCMYCAGLCFMLTLFCLPALLFPGKETFGPCIGLLCVMQSVQLSSAL